MNSRSSPFSKMPAWLCILFAFNGCLLFDLLGQAPKVASEDQLDYLEDLANIDFRTDVRVFTVMAALNVAGFDYESGDGEMSPVRKAVRQQLADLPRELVSELRLQYSAVDLRDPSLVQSAYISLALLLEGPPGFRFRENVVGLPAGVENVLGFEELLPQFYAVAEIQRLWDQYEPVYKAELIRYRSVLRDVIKETLAYFRASSRVVLDRNIILIPDLLSQKDIVNARNLEHTYYIVVGPAEDPKSNFVQLQHEYLHFLIDPLMVKSGASLLGKRDLLSLAHQQPNLSSDFRDRFLLIAGESLIETILRRLHPTGDDVQHEDALLFRRGLILAPMFRRALADYEKSDSSLPVFLQGLLKDLSEDEVKQDSERVAEFERQVEEEKQRQLAEQQRQLQERQEAEQKHQLLNEAGRALAKGNYALSRQKLEELLALDPSNGRANFYLGQIEAQQGNFEAASGYYGKVTRARDTEDWIRALALVRQGRFLASRKRYEEAGKKFREVLAMEGDLKGAREEARELIQHLPQGEP